MVGICAGVVATAKACLPLHEHCTSVVFEKDSAWFQDALPSIMVVHAKHVPVHTPILPGAGTQSY